MKYSCNYCNDQTGPCIVDVQCVDPEPPYSCIYANGESDMEAEWKPVEEKDNEARPQHEAPLMSDNLRSSIDMANKITAIKNGSTKDPKSGFTIDGARAVRGFPSMAESLKSDIAAANAMIDKNKRGKILMQALDIINGDRQDKYGKPEDSFELIAEYWNSYLIRLQKNILEKNGFSPKEYKLVPILDCKCVAEMMMLFKIARMSGQKPNLDNYLDLIGYAGIAADMVEEERK